MQKLTKKQKAKSQHQKQIDLFNEQEKKKKLQELKKQASSQLEEIVEVKKAEIHYENQQKALQQIQEFISSNSESFIESLSSLGMTTKDLIDALNKQPSDNTTQIKDIPDFSHFIVDKTKTSKKGGYLGLKDNINNLIKEAKESSKFLKIPHSITEQNRSTIIQNFLNQMKKVNSSLYTLFANLFSQQSNYQTVQQSLIREYTGNNYQQINKLLISGNPVELNSMNYYMNLAIKSFKEGSIGSIYKENRILYRNVPIPKDVLSLYKQNSFIYFTNFTSTSLLNLSDFGSSSQTTQHVQFNFKLLNISQQKQNQLYTGLKISDISYYKNEEEVLILPYQIFQIENISQGNPWIITLKEIDNKQIIEDIYQPSSEVIQSTNKNTASIAELQSFQKQLNTIKSDLKSKANEAKEQKKVITEKVKQQIEIIQENAKTIIMKSNITQINDFSDIIHNNDAYFCDKQEEEEEEEEESKQEYKPKAKASEIYTEIAGLIGELKGEVLDSHSNSKRGLGRDGMFGDCTLLIGCFYSMQNYLEQLLLPSLKLKGYKDCKIVTSEKEFVSLISGFNQVWVISNSQMNDKDIENQFVDSIMTHLAKQNGLMIWADNEPFFYHANLLLKRISVGSYQNVPIHIQLAGNDPGQQTLTAGQSNKQNQFGSHLLTTGLKQLYEGVTICYPTISSYTPQNNFGDLEIIGMSSANRPCFFALQGESKNGMKRGRIVIDCGFTKLYPSYWNNAGQQIYVQNAYAWLLWKERNQ